MSLENVEQRKVFWLFHSFSRKHQLCSCFIWRFSSCAFQCVSGLCLLLDGSGKLHDFSSTYWLPCRLRSLLFPLIFCFTRRSLECAIKLIQHLFYLYSWVYFWLSAHGKNSVKAKLTWSCVKPWVLRPQAAADWVWNSVRCRAGSDSHLVRPYLAVALKCCPFRSLTVLLLHKETFVEFIYSLHLSYLLSFENPFL